MIESWTYGWNTAPLDQTTATLQAASLHHQRKAWLVAGGWEVVQSCDGTNVVEGDCLTDLTKYVWSASGARSWYVMRSPTAIIAGLNGSYTGDQSRIWLTVHLNAAAVNTAELYIHNVVPSGTADTTHCPTTTAKRGYTAQTMLRSTYAGNAMFHFLRTNKGHWIEFVGYNGAGYMPWGLMVPPISKPNKKRINDQHYPFAVGIVGNFQDTSGALYGYVCPYANYFLSWAPDGSALSCRLAAIGFGSGGSGYPIGYGFSASGDMWSGDFPISTVIIQGADTGKYGIIGELGDLRATGAGNMPQGAVNDPSTPTWVHIGDFLIPTDRLVSI